MIKNKNKVAIISTSLGSGGAERFASMLSFMVAKLDIEVHNIIINDAVDYDYSGPLLNLGTLDHKVYFLPKRINKGMVLNRYLKNNTITHIIDNRARNNSIRDLVSRFIFGKRKKMYVVHNFNLKNYFPKSTFMAEWLYQDATKLVCVSHAIEEQVKLQFGFKNTITIHNPIDFSRVEKYDMTMPFEKYILFFGRLENKSKNFDLLLEAFSLSGIYHKGYPLKILGSGPDLEAIKNKIKTLQLDDFVTLLPFTKTPFEWVAKAKFTVLSSRYEGFPMSIIESLAHGTPVVAVDCNSGPREVIKNEYNGVLVENNNPQALANAMNQLIDDPVLYNFCKNNAAKSVEHLFLAAISKQWEAILL